MPFKSDALPRRAAEGFERMVTRLRIDSLCQGRTLINLPFKSDALPRRAAEGIKGGGSPEGTSNQLALAD
ncbi:hypothetical protein [Sphingobacterium bambusae]|uniref:Uncharacterized protein n=1 Tax=Sphingobacterium bambusae TaxID=662858 RepID=A0ABW6BPS4_9SPHI|nr:hypothetical protein [Sphingobacterium bambusae]WPL47888.1 hypothetical protein SCB77_18220 [Sphingobacterium bambusae]